MPVANTSKLEPSGSERMTAPWFGYDQILPLRSVTWRPMSPTSQ